MVASKELTRLLATYHPTTIEFVGTHCVQLLCFWLPSAIYLGIHSFFPKFSIAHKIQPNEKQPTPKDIAYCLRIVLRNQLMSSSLHILILVAHRLSTTHNLPPYDFNPELPPLTRIVWDIVLSAVIREALFYYSHRILHIPQLYAPIHKFHHKFTAPVALAAQFAHPVEHFISNILPVLLPPQLLRCHIVTWWIFLGLELIETTTVHSGYDFFWGGIARMHDLHHEKFRVNYGTMGLFDRIHGTFDRARPTLTSHTPGSLANGDVSSSVQALRNRKEL